MNCPILLGLTIDNLEIDGQHASSNYARLAFSGVRLVFNCSRNVIMKLKQTPARRISYAVKLGALWAALIFAIGGVAVAATTERRLMVVTTDMTKEGKKISPPTAERPAYYVPVSLGYSETGDVAQHYQRKPAEEPILRGVIEALAKQHYLIASRDFPPTLTIVIEWGTVTPVYYAQQVVNAWEIRARVLGDQEWDLGNAGYTADMKDLRGRHFLTISAFAYQREATKKQPDILLWRAHSTTDHWGNFLDEIIQPLITVATPALGRATKPGAVWSDRIGHVEIGESVVSETDVKRRP